MNKFQEIPWPRILAEGIAIVVSILLAFSIEAWWTDRQEQAEQERILLALKKEFETNLATIEEQLSYRRTVLVSVLQILDASAGKTTVDKEEFDRLLGDVVWTGWLDLSTGAMASLLQSGKLSLIENEELRQHLAAFPYWTETVVKMENFEMDRLDRDLIPFFYEATYMPQIYNTMKGQPGVGNNPNPSILPTTETRDHRDLLHNSKFIGMMATERMDHNDAIFAYDLLKEQSNTAIRMIDAELEGHR